MKQQRNVKREKFSKFRGEILPDNVWWEMMHIPAVAKNIRGIIDLICLKYQAASLENACLMARRNA